MKELIINSILIKTKNKILRPYTLHNENLQAHLLPLLGAKGFCVWLLLLKELVIDQKCTNIFTGLKTSNLTISFDPPKKFFRSMSIFYMHFTQHSQNLHVK